MKGVKIEVRHSTVCRAQHQRDTRGCNCEPTARAKVAGVWVKKVKLAKGWTLADLTRLESEAGRMKDEHRTGRREIVLDEVPTLKVWGEDFLEETRQLVADGDLSPGTLVAYESRWSRYIEPVLGDLLLTRIRDAHVKKLREGMRAGEWSRPRRVVAGDGTVTYEKKGLSDDSAGQVIQLLAAMLNAAIPKHLDSNPCTAPRRERRGKRKLVAPTIAQDKVMAPELSRALLASTSGVLHDMILTGLTTGRRRREISGLLTSELQLRAHRAAITNQRMYGVDRPPKTGPRAGIVCPSLAARLTVRLEHATHYVFVQDPHHEHPGEPFDEFQMQKVFNEAWEAIGERPKGHSWHVLRHTFATTLRVGGVSQFVIDYLMGHDSEGGKYVIPALYQHVLDQELDQALEVIEVAFGKAAIPVGT